MQCQWFCQWINSWIAQFARRAHCGWVSNLFYSSQCSAFCAMHFTWKWEKWVQCLTLATDRWFVFTVLIEPFIIRGEGAKVFTRTNLSPIIPYYLCYPDLSVLITVSSSQSKKYFIEIQGALSTNDLLQYMINVCKIHPSHPINLNHTICHIHPIHQINWFQQICQICPICSVDPIFWMLPIHIIHHVPDFQACLHQSNIPILQSSDIQ